MILKMTHNNTFSDGEESFGPLVKSINDKLSTLHKNNEQSKRYTLYPIRDNQSYKFYNKICKGFWFASTINFTEDVSPFRLLGSHEQHVILSVLASFAHMEGVINANIISRLLYQSSTMEESLFYTMQMANEAQHSESYSLMINTLVSNEEERRKYFDIVSSYDVADKKDKWLESYTVAELPRDYILIAFACAEGIFFISGFMIIFWLKTLGLMNTVVHANEYIARDETLHRDFAIHRLKSRGNLNKLSRDKVLEIVNRSVELEIEFLHTVFNGKRELTHESYTLSRDDIEYYIRYLAGNLLDEIDVKDHGYPTDGSKIPSWMNMLSMLQKNNFYEKHVTNYSMFNNVTKEEEKEDNDNMNEYMNKYI
jgi:ribonucleotide reductase beta subunit family protein with ferritin-like domain